jgi:hypothetical protein
MKKIRTIRAAAAARVKLTGVIVLAADVGITPLELNAFIIGVIPQGDVHTRLELWFQREAEQTEIAAVAEAGRETVARPQASVPGKREVILSAKEFRQVLRALESEPPPANSRREKLPVAARRKRRPEPRAR